MLFNELALLSALSAGCLAVQADRLAPRQGDGSIIFTTICLGPRCSDAPAPTTAPPKTTLRTTTTSKKTTSSTKEPTKTSSPSQPTKTQTEEVGPSSTRCPVPLYYQCGGYHDGKPWTGCEVCVKGAKCIWQNDWYYQCVADDGSL
ncbi:hypothetical protein DPSP01_004396 [Paraphaeosphaeria sporulosa]|uniref:CBM1 domain-containing protein n=1 Tax=Paraphaeosphaeria sporulosa TaxID=1460663 RepID=A0A177CIL9_9PLEO|nr:uncharacterized protein CC84DRAFT_634948 [Paraphaeosphaeria sporulosa]OAG07101.1 hypothetical protein CC84DRAFT_634948 [Paraphaeosphaeria sporulosa]